MKIVIFLLLTTLTTAEASAQTYPDSFIWGAAISAHQTEGAFEGGDNGDWYQFEHQTPAPILNGDNADLAVDFWHRYPEDLKIAKSLGINSLRISIAWEKVEPSEGQFNPEVIAHYRDILLMMRSLGIRPMVALHHCTHPLWFQAQGGWLTKQSPLQFARYADYVVSQLGDLCDLWITFNEPMVLVNEGFITGKFPPLVHSIPSAFEAAFNLARAHRLATALIHLRQPPVARSVPGLHGVGLVNSLPLYAPKSAGNPIDELATYLTDEFANWAFLDAAVNGKLIWHQGIFESDMKRELPKIEQEISGVTSSPEVDWLGMNYYSRYEISMDWSFHFHAESKSPTGVVGDNGWAVYPEGLEKVLRKGASRFHVPWIVSENGVADVSDRIRPDFIKQSLQSLDHVVTGEHPLDVRGYYHWSLMDNFEWLLGYTQKFGLVQVDFENNLTRTPRSSAYVYQSEIESRSGLNRH
jgi:beta-glucosidase